MKKKTKLPGARCSHGEHYSHSDSCFWEHSDALVEALLSAGNPAVLVGSLFAVEKFAQELRGVGVQPSVICEDPVCPADQKVHKRHFLSVPFGQWVQACAHFENELGKADEWWRSIPKLKKWTHPPYSTGLCGEHPRWTSPCPDCFRW